MLSRPSLNDFTNYFIRFEAQSSCALFGGSKKREIAFTHWLLLLYAMLLPKKRNVLLAIFRLPKVPMLPRSFLNAFTVNFASFEVQLR